MENKAVPAEDRLPPWLEKSKDVLLDTSQWHILMAEVYEKIQVKLSRKYCSFHTLKQVKLGDDRISFFSDLTEPEQELFMEEIEVMMSKTSEYRSFLRIMNRAFDRALTSDVANQLVENRGGSLTEV
jgi:hypothetical protein